VGERAVSIAGGVRGAGAERWRGLLVAARSRWLRTILPAVEAIRAGAGFRRGVGVRDAAGENIAYYKELTPERLNRALSRRGRGFKDYRVTFADGSKLVVRCSREVCYSDLMGPEGLHRYARRAELVRPGSRVLDIAPRVMSSGYGGAYLAELVGRAGSVVCLLGDAQAAVFAARRYGGLNLSLESVAEAGALELNLVGEVNGAFDAAIALEPEGAGMGVPSLVREMARAVRVGGVVVLGRGGEAGRLHPEFIESLGLEVIEMDEGEMAMRRVEG